MPILIGTESATAVNAESFRGETFLVFSMTGKATSYESLAAEVDCSWLTANSSELEFISHSFYRGYAIDAKFLTDLSNMYIDGAVTNDYIIAPNLAQDLIA